MVQSTQCLSCTSKSLEKVLDLGTTPLANRFIRPEDLGQAEPRFELAWLFCSDCGLVQLSELVDPEILFAHYLYMTGWSSTMKAHHERLARHHVQLGALNASSLVVDIASNDGSLLREFQQHGVQVLGVEPARNLAEVAREQGVETVSVFFDAEQARSLREERGAAACACANNVFAHVPAPGSFVEGMRILTEPEGFVSVEVPYLVPLLDKLEYDTVYHEHMSYFSIRALAHLFERAGLAIFDLQHVAVHGGTVRVLARAGSGHADCVRDALDEERARGLEDVSTYLAFAERVAENKRALRRTLEDLRSAGKRVAAYGAPAKGNTLLNTCAIGTDLVEYTVDKNPLKVGTLTPGMHLPVKEHSFLAEDQPDVALILPWNLRDEIVEQEAAFRAKGGQFLVPIPEPQLLT